MKRIFQWVLMTGCSAVLFGASSAAASPSCSPGDSFCVSTSDADADPTTGRDANPLAPATSQLPSQGIVAAGPQDVPSQSSYLFYDGRETNPDPLGGYLGLNTTNTDSGNSVEVVGSTVGTDDFSRAGGNDPIVTIGASHTPLSGPPPVGP